MRYPWESPFAVCQVSLGPGAEHLRLGHLEVWGVYVDSTAGGKRRWLTGGTVDHANTCDDEPAMSLHQQALYTAEDAAAIALVLTDLYGPYPGKWQGLRIGAIRLK